MKKILIISPIPVSYPPKDGYSMVVFYRSYFLKKLLNIQSDIIVSENEEYPAKNLVDSGVFHNVFSYPMNKKWKSLIKFIYSGNIYYMLRFDINNKYLNNIINFIKYEEYYAVIFEHSFSYPLYQKLIKNISVDKSNVIYSSHNIDYIDFKNLTYENKNLFKKIFYWITYKKLKKIEIDYIKKFSKICSVSKYEIKFLKNINPVAKVLWVPPILSILENTNKDQKNLNEILSLVGSYKYKILFIGGLNKSSNFISVIWFVNNVFSIIREKLNTCFIIVGKEPSKDILNLVKRNKDIFLFPNVPSVQPFYEISDLVVVPLFNPAGIKLKLIEALKYKKKVIARPEALLGAGLQDVVPNATEPEDFAKKCIDALEGRIDYEIVWKKFEDMYDNKRILDKFLMFIED